MRQLFVAWVPFQRRPLSMRGHFNYELEFLTLSFSSRLLRPLEYFIKSSKTLFLFLQKRPEVIWLQLPPTLLLYLSYFYQKIFDQTVLIIADCHNATFRSPWIKFPYVISLLNNCNLILVHSEQVENQIKDLGVSGEQIQLLEDPLTEIYEETNSSSELYPHPWVLCPCSFNRDEPIEELIEAARLVPDLTFVITGNISRSQGIHELNDIPDNLKLPGFLPLCFFNGLLLNTDAVLGLTKLDGIQLSAAVEATGIEKPMVLSNTSLLKKLFYKGAIYVDSNDPTSIAAGCQQVIIERDGLLKEVAELKEERNALWSNQAAKIDALLH